MLWPITIALLACTIAFLAARAWRCLHDSWIFFITFQQKVPQASAYFRKMRGDPATARLLTLGRVSFTARCGHL